MAIRKILLLSLVLLSAPHVEANSCRDYVFGVKQLRQDPKQKIKEVREIPDRTAGVVQITGKDLVPGQKKFPNRTPADPVVFTDKKTGEVYIYGTQVDGTGFSYLKYKNKAEMLRGAPGQRIERDVYLPNGQLLRGEEAIWDTYRLSYETLTEVFPRAELERFYKENNIDKDSDLYFGGISIQENGSLGVWPRDNWRRRIHPMAEVNGRLQVVAAPVFNRVPRGSSERDYVGFANGLIPALAGDYIGHAYGPNFKLTRENGKLELWMINEEVTRRVLETNGPVEVTEIVARKMISPFEAASERVELVSVNGKDGNPHKDSDRGPQMGNAKLIEGFRPPSVTPEGITITKRAVMKDGKLVLVKDPTLSKEEYFLLTGSAGNFAGDGYDVLLAARRGSAIGKYEMIETPDGTGWKKYLEKIKPKYRLSWAGRGTFVNYEGLQKLNLHDKVTYREDGWWLIFHATDKDIYPDGSYGGRIPENTSEYHRNLYPVPVEFYINSKGQPDMLVLD